MIDESLRQHYRRLFNMKPTIDTNRPKHWSPGGGRRRRPMSAHVNNVKTQSLRNSRQFSSNDHLTNREFWSSNDCIDGVGYDYGPPAQFQLNNSTVSKGLVKVQIMGSQGSLSDKIDNFFEEVNQQELECQKLHEEKLLRIEARKKYVSQRSISYQSSFDSRPSTMSRNQYSSNPALVQQRMKRSRDVTKKVSSSSSGEPQLKQSLRPQSAQIQPRKKINFVQQNIQKTKSRPSALIIPRSRVADNVESRLKYNRNYQAPRRKKIVIKEPSVDQRPEEKSKEDYEADFESDEYDNDDDYEVNVEEHEAAQQRHAWLMEQAERGRARQRALMSRVDPSQDDYDAGVVNPEPRTFQEKESSRDSAYGFSADSRIPTREPTPDYRMMYSQNKQRILHNIRMKKEQMRSKSKSTEDLKKENEEFNKKKAHLRFLTDVTNDIISRGLYSERGLRSALNSQVKKTEYEISSLEMENLLRQLKLELGIDNNQGSKQLSKSNNLSHLLSSSRLSKSKVTSSGGQTAFPPAPPNRKTLQEIKEFSRKHSSKADNKILDDLDERQIKEILKDASLDSDMVNSIIGMMTKDEVKSEDSTDSPKLFNNFNISSFNVSFNAGKQLQRSKENSSSEEVKKKKSTVLQRRMVSRQESSSPDRVESSLNNKRKVPTNKNIVETSQTQNIKRETAIVFSSPTPRSSSPLYQPEETDSEDKQIDEESVEEEVEEPKEEHEEYSSDSDSDSEVAEEVEEE